MQIKEARALTHRGRRKEENEDGVLQIPDVPLYVVVDGAGGTDAQAAALEIMRSHTRSLYKKVRSVADTHSSENRLDVGAFFEDVFNEIHRKLLKMEDDLQNTNLASSMICATLVGECAYLAHVGNARAYLLRNEELWVLTNDHTVAMAQLTRGLITDDEYESSPHKLVLTQALGQSTQIEMEFAEVWLRPGDVLLLCSDGLTRCVADQQICEILHSQPLADATKDLVRTSLVEGAPDNVSVITMEVAEAEDDTDLAETDIISTFRNVFLFTDMMEADRMVIAPYLEDIAVEPGQVIVREGENGDHFYVVIEGNVRVSLGQTHLVDIGPGGQFGELGLVGDSRRTASVTAIDQCRLFALSRERFHQILREKPHLSAKLLLPLLERVKDRLTDVTSRLAQLEQSSH